jgi:hypothetical protein
MSEFEPDDVRIFVYATAYSVAFRVFNKAGNRLGTFLDLLTR